MTVSSTINRISYVGNGVTTEFDVPFTFFNADELQVIERVLATGAELVKLLDDNYSVTGGDGSTGKVLAQTPPSSTVSWTVLRRTRRIQSIDFTDNDPFPAETHERGLDRVTLIAQDSASSVDRAIRFPATDSGTLNPEIPNNMARAGKYLAFDSEGLPIASTGPVGTSEIPVSSYIEGLLDDTDAATARATLGLTIGTDVAAAGVSGDFVGRITAYVGAAAPSGWLLLNGDTIGNVSSGAVHESTVFEDLYVLFWNSMADQEAPISTGRGASGANDWIAGKALTLPDIRGRTIVGTGTGGGLTARSNGVVGGSETHLLTADESGVAAHVHGGWQGGSQAQVAGDSDDGIFPRSGMSANTGAVVGGPQDAASDHNNIQPFLALTYIVKY